MTDLIFNKDTDRYIYTGSRLRAGTTNNKLRLSSAYNESIIDLCNNGVVDISASSVFINGLKVVTTSSGDATSLTALQLAQNLDVSGLITSDGGIQIGSGSYGGKIYKSANLYELVIDPFTIDASNNISDASGQVTIMGDLVVRGNTTTISSTNVDISDVLLTLASGGATGNVNGAGIQLGNDGYASLLWNSTYDIWNFNKGITINGELSVNTGTARFNGNSVLLSPATSLQIGNDLITTTLNARIMPTWTGTVMKTSTNLYSGTGDTSSNTWLDASGWFISMTNKASGASKVKIEARIAYTSSPEADQTLSFRLLKQNGASAFNTLFTDLSLGSNMGVSFNGVHMISFFDTAGGSDPTYKIEFMRNCPNNDTISTPFGIRVSTGNYMFLQEYFFPD